MLLDGILSFNANRVCLRKHEKHCHGVCTYMRQAGASSSRYILLSFCRLLNNRLRLFAENCSTGHNATTMALPMSVCCAKTRCRLAKTAWWTHRLSLCVITPTNTYSGTACTPRTPSTRSLRTLSSSARKMSLTAASLGWASSVPLQPPRMVSRRCDYMYRQGLL